MVRYRKLGYVELNVTNLERSRDFYRDFVGLEHIGSRGGAELFRCDPEEPYSVVLHEAKDAGYKRAGWILEDESQFAVLQRRLDDAGCPWVMLDPDECGERGFMQAMRMSEPCTGATLEFYLPAGTREVSPVAVTHTKFQRLGHVVWATPERDEAIEFFMNVLNFRMSDMIGTGTAFLRPFPTPWHHGIGIGRSSHRHFHHLNFMVQEIDDVGKCLHRARKHEVPIVFGPGRHVASGSIFLYFLDPDGTTLEYSFGMEMFPEENPREPEVLPLVPESFDSWGAVRDPRMGTSGVVEKVTIPQWATTA